MFGRKKELARLRRSVEINEKRINDWDELLGEHEKFQRWVREHAPATLRRYPGNTPRIRTTSLERLDRMLKDAYLPQLRSMLSDSNPLFEQINQSQGQPVTFDVEL